MAVLRLVGLSLLAGLLLVAVGVATAQPAPRHPAAAPPTSVSSRYVVAGDAPFPVLRVGANVYVAGVQRVARLTGSAVVLSIASGKAEPVVASVAGGSVKAVVADNAGGWYIGGTFTSVGGLPRPGLAHLLADGRLDTTFAPPDLGWVDALALDGGRLYVGGTEPPAGTAWFTGFLSALDPSTGALLPISYPLLANSSGGRFGVVALAAQDDKLYAAFSSYNGIAAYDGGSGTLLWSRPFAASDLDAGPEAFALVAGRLLVGGQLSTTNGAIGLEELDPASGALVGTPDVGGPVTGMATTGDIAYLIGGPGPHRANLWKLDLTSGKLTRRAGCHFCSAPVTDGATLYMAKWAPVTGPLRVYSLDLNQAKPRLRPLSPATVGTGPDVDALGLQDGHLLLGGSFLALGGVKRTGLAAFNARTGKLLSWRPTVKGGAVSALAHSGQTIYLGGDFSRLNGKRRDGLAAVSARGRGKLLPWRPRLSSADVSSLAVASGRVFAGGSLKPYPARRATPTSSLLAFSARSGKRVAFKPRPSVGDLQALTVWHGLLLVGSGPAQGSQAGVTAFQTQGNGRAVWTQTVKDGNVPIVFALQTAGTTLYVGGRFSQIGGQARSNLAALDLGQNGALLPFAPTIPDQVMAMAQTTYGLVYATMTLNGTSWWSGAQALGAISPDGEILPWQVDFPPDEGVVSIERIAVVPGGLVVSGGFSWIGPLADPAPGSLVWIR